jgi:hypothetical protein
MRLTRCAPLVAIAAGCGILLAGCTATAPSPKTTTSAAPVSPADIAAAKLAQNPTIPPGARPVNSLPGKEFANPSQVPACKGIGLKTLYWVAPGSITSVQDYLKTHPAPGFDAGNAGTETHGGTLVSASVSENFTGKVGKQAQVVYSIAPTVGGRIGIRLDAEVVPTDAPCTSAG